MNTTYTVKHIQKGLTLFITMIAALRSLCSLKPGTLPDSLKAMGIAEGKRTSLWSTHPSFKARIAVLNNLRIGV